MGRPYPATRCEVVEWIASALQDFMADAYGVYWPSVGELRLTLEVNCVGDRPRLVLAVPVHRAVQKG